MAKDRTQTFHILAVVIIAVLLVSMWMLPSSGRRMVYVDTNSLDGYALYSLSNGAVVKQSFGAAGYRLEQVDIIVAGINDDSDAEIHITITEMSHGTTALEMSIPASSLQSGLYSSLTLPHTRVNLGAGYYLQITADGMADEEDIKVMAACKDYAASINDELLIDNESQPGYALATNYVFETYDAGIVAIIAKISFTLVTIFLAMVFMTDRLKNLDKQSIWTICMGIFLVCFMMAALLSHGYSVQSITYQNEGDYFMDFFNCLNVSTKTYDGIYPPLARTIFLLFTRIIFNGNSGRSDAVRSASPGMMVYLVYVIIFMYLLFMLLHRMLGGSSGRYMALVTEVLLSLPMLFTLERGNIILISFVATLFYVRYYQSDKKWQRGFAYVALGVAAGIKLYPAIFALLLTKGGKIPWSKTFALAASIVGFVVVPFALYPSGSLQLLLSAMSTTQTAFQYIGFGFRHDITNDLNILSSLLDIGIHGRIYTIARWSILLSGVFVSFFSRRIRDWQISAICASLIVLYPSFSYTYTLIFMIIPLLGFLIDKERTRFDIVYIIGFLLIFADFVVPTKDDLFGLVGMEHPLTYAMVLQSIGVLIIFIGTIAHVGYDTVVSKRNQRRTQVITE